MTSIIRTRASSLADLADCPARWKAKHIDKITLPSSGKAALGTAIHVGTAVYDVGQMNQAPVSPADCAAVAADAVRSPDEEVDWFDIPQGKAIDLAVDLTIRYTELVQPTWAAVEPALPPLQVTLDSGRTIELTGHPDNVIKHGDGFRVRDRKSGTRVVTRGGVDTSLHRGQLGVYEILIEQAYGPITGPAEIVAMPTSRHGAPIVVAPVEGAKDHALDWLPILDMYLEHDLWPGNPRSMMCSEKYCPIYHKCKYRAPSSKG